jgi:hypothetical protein
MNGLIVCKFDLKHTFPMSGTHQTGCALEKSDHVAIPRFFWQRKSALSATLSCGLLRFCDKPW